MLLHSSVKHSGIARDEPRRLYSLPSYGVLPYRTLPGFRVPSRCGGRSSWRSPLPSNTSIPQLTPFTTPNGIRIQSAVLPQYTFRTDRQTDRKVIWHDASRSQWQEYAHIFPYGTESMGDRGSKRLTRVQGQERSKGIFKIDQIFQSYSKNKSGTVF